MTERKPQSAPGARSDTPQLQFRTIHGYQRAFRIAGSGPVILLIHGIGDNSTTWKTVQAKLAQRFTVIAAGSAGPRAVRQAARRLLGRRVRQRDARSAVRARHRAGDRRGSFAGRWGGDAIRLPVPATGRAAGPGRRRRRHQGCQRRLPAGVAADGQRGAGVAAIAPGAAGVTGCRASGRPGDWVDRAWATTCPTCCGSWTTYRSRRPRRRSPGPCGRWWTGAGRSSPCWIDVI